MLHSPARRSFGTPITNNSPGPGALLATKSPAFTKSPAKKAAKVTKSPASRPAAPQSAKKAQPKREEVHIFGRYGVLEDERGPTPDAEAFGVRGVLERERGPTPAFALQAQLEAAEVAAFCEAHQDATMAAGRVTCETTGHEV